MAGTKLTQLKAEINHWLGIPYLYSGKGHWKDIKLISDDYNYLKKHKIGIDCSGLAYHLLNFYCLLILNQPLSKLVTGTNNQSDVRHLSADLLTSAPNAIAINDYSSIQTADLIRTKNGHHVLFVVEKKDGFIHCVDSSRQGRGVRLSTLSPSQLSATNGVYRLSALTTSLPSTPDT